MIVAQLIVLILHEMEHLKVTKYRNKGFYYEKTPERIFNFKVKEAGTFSTEKLFGGDI